MLPGIHGIGGLLTQDTAHHEIQRNDAATVVLLKFEGSDGSREIVDSALGGNGRKWRTRGNAQLDDSQSKFGSTSLRLDKAKYYSAAETDNSDDFDFDGDFTIDFWLRPNFSSNLLHYIARNTSSYRTDDEFEAGWSIMFSPEWGLMFHVAAKNTNQYYLYGAYKTDFATDGSRWYHVAIVRAARIFKVYIDGIYIQNIYQTGEYPARQNHSITSSGKLYIGYRLVGRVSSLGWIDEFRISKGVARWQRNFYPPTEPYSD